MSWLSDQLEGPSTHKQGFFFRGLMYNNFLLNYLYDI